MVWMKHWTTVALVLLSASLLIASVSAASSVTEETFDDIKNSPLEQAVLFYHGSDSKSKDAVKTFKKVAKEIREDLPHFRFKKCDCELPVNHKECSEAQFTSGYYVFTQTPTEGIVKFGYPLSVTSLSTHIKHKYLPVSDDEVVQFTTEDEMYERLDSDDDKRPVFIKFYEKWCEHCKRLARPFAQAAGYFKDSVEFVEVECSRDEDTTEFCTKNEVRNYPVLMLFNGEDKIQFNEEMRSILTFQDFFEKNVPGFGEEPEEEEAPKKKSTKKKAKKRTDEDDEEEVIIKKKSKKAAPKEEEEEPVEAEVKATEEVNKVGVFSRPKKSSVVSTRTLGIPGTLESRFDDLVDLVQELSKQVSELKARLPPIDSE